MTIEITETTTLRILVTVEEAAEALRVGRTTVFHLIRTGELDSVRIGRLRRVPLDELRRFAKEHRE